MIISSCGDGNGVCAAPKSNQVVSFCCQEAQVAVILVFQ